MHEGNVPLEVSIMWHSADEPWPHNDSAGAQFDLIRLCDGSHCPKQQDSWSCKAGLTAAHVLLDTKINAGSQETSACAEMEVEIVPFH